MSKIFDVCVIGSGPAGLASALTLAKSGLHVALIESGGDNSAGVAAQSLSEARIDTPQSHAPMSHAVRRGLGGTSALWGGRCVPLDSNDFTVREYVPHSGWPLCESDLKPYYDAACRFLGAGEANFTVGDCQSLQTHAEPLSAHMQNTARIRAIDLERWSASPNAWHNHREAVKNHPLIDIFSGHTCTGWTQQTAGQLVNEAKVVITPEGKTQAIKARVHILAAGGVESTRLILNSMHDADGLKPAAPDLVGRYYMGHPSGKISSIELNGSPKKTIYGFERDGKHYVRRRITLQNEALKENKLLNICFWLDNPALADSRHKSGVLSAAFLALTMPMIGRRLAPTAIRERMTSGQKLNKIPHLLNCFRAPCSTLKFVFKFAYQRYLEKPRVPGFFTYSGTNRYALHFHAEQAPNPESRIVLDDSVDATGLRRARIALRWSKQDVDSIIAAHKVLDLELRAKGIGHLDYSHSEDQLHEAVITQAVDGFHQIGTLRMAKDATEGVTDASGRLFGTSNFYIASSAIFPTSGQANPTLAMVALAMRQAKLIASSLVNPS
jgi:choline dehydrogenase-like flavoprotein